MDRNWPFDDTCFSLRTLQQNSTTKRVDTAWNAPVRDDSGSIGCELWIVLPANKTQAVLDIGARVSLIEWAEVVRRDDALSKLLHQRRPHQNPQLGLTDEKTLQQSVIAALKIRQHAQLFQRAGTSLRSSRSAEHAFLLEMSHRNASIVASGAPCRRAGLMPTQFATDAADRPHRARLTICAATTSFGSSS